MLPVTKQYCLERFVLLYGERSEECVRLASGDYNITEPSQFDTNAAQFLKCSRRIVFVSRGHLQIGGLIVQFLRSRLVIEPVSGLECHHSTTTIAKLGRSCRSVSLYNLGGNTSIPVSAIRRGEKHSRKELLPPFSSKRRQFLAHCVLCSLSFFLYCCRCDLDVRDNYTEPVLAH